MALTFTLNGVAFAALGSGTGRMALGIDSASPQQDIKRFHVPGGDGNYIVRGGRAGAQVTARFRYVGTLATLYSNFAADKAAWADTAGSIVSPEGTLQRCSLNPGGARIIREPQAKGDGNAYMDCEAVFTSDA